MATAVQKARTAALYRDSLKTLLSWAVARDIFYVKVSARKFLRLAGPEIESRTRA